MIAVFSSTYDPKYDFFIPIVSYCWNKMGVRCICLMPAITTTDNRFSKHCLLIETIEENNIDVEFYDFWCAPHKEATYSQISRLFAASLRNFGAGSHLITTDVDMIPNTVPFYDDKFTVWGSDLVPPNQFPMCYARGTVKEWRTLMKIGDKSFQECLDEIMNPIECENIRGNYWGLDQEILYRNTHEYARTIGRAREGTQFAAARIDRDDAGWRNNLGNFTDAHLWRPGFEENNFNNLMELLAYKFPDDNFKWLIDFKNEYIKLL